MPVLTVEVPAGVAPGQQFFINHAGSQMAVQVPPGVSAGQQIQVQVPDPVQAADPNALNHPGHWKYMISYKQTEAKEEALALAHELTGNKDDVWLDVHSKDQSVDAMKEGVLKSDAFVCILTPLYFQSEYCLSELEWAIKSEKPIISCYPSDQNVGEILKTAPDSVAADIKSVDSKRLETSNPQFWAVSLDMIRTSKGGKAGAAAGAARGAAAGAAAVPVPDMWRRNSTTSSRRRQSRNGQGKKAPQGKGGLGARPQLAATLNPQKYSHDELNPQKYSHDASRTQETFLPSIGRGETSPHRLQRTTLTGSAAQYGFNLPTLSAFPCTISAVSCFVFAPSFVFNPLPGKFDASVRRLRGFRSRRHLPRNATRGRAAQDGQPGNPQGLERRCQTRLLRPPHKVGARPLPNVLAPPLLWLHDGPYDT